MCDKNFGRFYCIDHPLVKSMLSIPQLEPLINFKICFPIFMSNPPRHCEPFDARKRTYFPLLSSLVWPITSLVRSGRVGQESGPITRPQSRHSRPSRPHTVGVPAVALGWQEGQRQVLDTRIQKYRNVLEKLQRRHRRPR